MLLPAARSKTILSTEYAGFLRALRSRSFTLVRAAAALALLACIPLQAQEPGKNDDEVVKVNTDLFVIPIRVKDKRRPAGNLLSERDLVLKDPDRVTAGLTLYHGADRVALLSLSINPAACAKPSRNSAKRHWLWRADSVTSLKSR